MQFWDQIWFREALPRSCIVCPSSYHHFLQWDHNLHSKLHVEELQISAALWASQQTLKVSKHNHHIPQTCQEHLQNNTQLQLWRSQEMVCIKCATGTVWRNKPMYYIYRHPINLIKDYAHLTEEHTMHLGLQIWDGWSTA